MKPTNQENVKTNDLSLRPSLVSLAMRHRQWLLMAAVVLFAGFAVPGHANAAVIDFQDFYNAWPVIKTFLMFLGGCICVGMLIMTVVKLIGRDWGEALMFAAGAAFSAFLIAHAAGWIGGETGITNL